MTKVALHDLHIGSVLHVMEDYNTDTPLDNKSYIFSYLNLSTI